MKKEITDKVLTILSEADKAYVRLIREYSTLEHTTDVKNKIRKYVADIKEVACNDIFNLLNAEKEALILSAKVKPQSRDTAQEVKRNTEILLMKSAIEGANNEQLIELVSKYGNTEYEEEFKTMIQPRIKGLAEDNTPTRAKSQDIISRVYAELNRVPDSVSEEVQHLEGLNEDIRSLMYFNNSNFGVSVQANEEGRILHGNWDARNIENDIKFANETFNPLNERLEPLIVVEKMGLQQFKTIRYQFDWD